MENKTAADVSLAIGASLNNGRYKIERHLASGGFGNTYLAWDGVLDGYVAIKEFYMSDRCTRNPHTDEVTVSLPNNQDLFDQQREKFRKEARRLWKLHNPHIVRVQDLFDENGTTYYTMDYIEGASLADYLRQHANPLGEDEVRGILNQLLDALDAIHQAGFCHLDLKPRNVMRDNQGNIYLIDFGASKQVVDANGHTIATSSLLLGTPGYAPMEQMTGNYRNCGPWTDIYALGATLYNLLTKRPLPNVDEIAENPSEALPMPATISQQMQNLILWMMKPQRTKRPQNIDEIRKYIGQSMATPEVKQEEPKIVERPNVKVDDNQTELIGGVKPVTPKKEPVNIEESGEDGGSSSKLIKYIGLTAIAFIAVLFTVKGVGGCSGSGAGSDTIENSIAADFSEVDDKSFTVNGVTFKMIGVQGGTFTMGGTSEQGSDAESDEKPTHSVTLSSYFIGETEVTQALWEAVMGSNPSYFEGPQKPVEQVSWNDCQTFISNLNSLTGQHFRLPTEAEWEYASRGGNKSRGYKYSGSNTLSSVAWYYDNSGSITHDVKTKSPNELGIYDMSGNVWEWCQDWYGSYGSSSQTNPTGASSGSGCVNRGGSWNDIARYCRVSNRDYFAPAIKVSNLGLRLVL